MGTILIDKLLSACVKQGASDLHITVGQPPVLRLHGRMQRLKTKILEGADTQALMKSGLLDQDIESASLRQFRTTPKGVEYLAAAERMSDMLAIETRRAKPEAFT